MTTFELAGRAMMQAHEGNRGLAQAIAEFFARRRALGPASLAGATFLDLEPDLASEARLPEHMRII